VTEARKPCLCCWATSLDVYLFLIRGREVIEKKEEEEASILEKLILIYIFF
jgi:hypothetical protein